MGNRKNTQIFGSFENLAKEYKLPIITVYFSPEDFPDIWVARLFDTEKPTEYFALANTLDALRTLMPCQMEILERSPYDIASIKEVWL